MYKYCVVVVVVVVLGVFVVLDYYILKWSKFHLFSVGNNFMYKFSDKKK